MEWLLFKIFVFIMGENFKFSSDNNNLNLYFNFTQVIVENVCSQNTVCKWIQIWFSYFKN